MKSIWNLTDLTLRVALVLFVNFGSLFMVVDLYSGNDDFFLIGRRRAGGLDHLVEERPWASRDSSFLKLLVQYFCVGLAKLSSFSGSKLKMQISNEVLLYKQQWNIPSELSRENFISSHVKITCYLHMWRDHRRHGYMINRVFVVYNWLVSKSRILRAIILDFITL